jgi:hypothetical protein
MNRRQLLFGFGAAVAATVNAAVLQPLARELKPKPCNYTSISRDIDLSAATNRPLKHNFTVNYEHVMAQMRKAQMKFFMGDQW